MNLEKVIYVGIGGFIGACLRYIISIYVPKILGDELPYQTLIVNVLGGFLIGFIFEVSILKKIITPDLKVFLTTGVMGGLTTFSTFSLETVELFMSKSYLLGSINILLNLGLSLFAVVFGKVLGSLI